MSNFNLPLPQAGKDIDETINNLMDSMYIYRKQLNYLLQNLTLSNMPLIGTLINSVEDDLQGLSTTLSMTAGEIRSEVQNELFQVSTLISQTSDSILNQVTSMMNGMQSIIEQTEEAISQRIATIDGNYAEFRTEYDNFSFTVIDKIQGTNYLLKSNEKQYFDEEYTTGTNSPFTLIEGYANEPSPTSYNNKLASVYELSTPLEEDKTYTISISEIDLPNEPLLAYIGDAFIGYLEDGTITFIPEDNYTDIPLIIKNGEGNGINFVKLEENEKATPWTPAEGTLGDIATKQAKMQHTMTAYQALWHFLDTNITFSNDGMFISNDNSDMGILISNDRISFRSQNTEVAYISGNILSITSGTFIETLQVANHVIRAVTPENKDVTVFDWLGGE